MREEEPSRLEQRPRVQSAWLQRGPERRLGNGEWRRMGDGWGGWQGFVAILGACLGSQVWWESLQGLYWKVTCSDLRKPSSVCGE